MGWLGMELWGGLGCVMAKGECPRRIRKEFVSSPPIQWLECSTRGFLPVCMGEGR